MDEKISKSYAITIKYSGKICIQLFLAKRDILYIKQKSQSKKKLYNKSLKIKHRDTFVEKLEAI